MGFSHHFVKSSVAIFVSTVLMAGCSSTGTTVQYSDGLPAVSKQAANHPAVDKILATDVEKLWEQDFDHHQPGLLKQVSDAITLLANQGKLNSPRMNANNWMTIKSVCLLKS
jgi:microbial collagenase